jgi:hypothetical protein
MDAEAGAVKRTGAGEGSVRGFRYMARGTSNECRTGRVPGLFPFETLSQAADLNVEEARFYHVFVFGVDERQVIIG